MTAETELCPYRGVATFTYPSDVTQDRPYPFYDALRRDAPAHKIAGTDIYLITRYEDVVAALADRDSFASARPWTNSVPAEVAAILAEGWPSPPLLVSEDPPSHNLHRRLSSAAFSPKRIAGLKPRIHAVANALIDLFADDGKVDFVEQYADILPVRVIAEALRVPPEDGETFRRWSNDMLAAMAGGLSVERELECAHSTVAFQRYIKQQIDHRGQTHDGTVISDLVHARDEHGNALSESEIINLSATFLRAGFETTVQLLGNVILALLQNPGQLALVLADSSLIPKAVEEAMRYDSPAQRVFRSTTRIVEVAGVKIPAGAQVLLMLGAANRDPSAFSHPDQFDIARSGGNQHIGFGYAYHFCLGAPLAREEAIVTLKTVLERLKNLRLAAGINDLHYKSNPILRGLRHLYLEFDTP